MLDPGTFPAAGVRVRVVARSGSYTGRVLGAAPGLFRIKDGAGIWVFELAELLAVTELAPRPTPSPTAEQVARAARLEQNRLSRLFARWP